MQSCTHCEYMGSPGHMTTQTRGGTFGPKVDLTDTLWAQT